MFLIKKRESSEYERCGYRVRHGMLCVGARDDARAGDFLWRSDTFQERIINHDAQFLFDGLASVVWLVYAYSLSFGPDVGGLIGNLSYFMGNGVGAAVKEGLTIPHSVFMMFQRCS